MNTLHDLDNSEYLARFPLDMDSVARLALQRKPTVRRWRVEFNCAGPRFIWDGEAAGETEAIQKGRMAIYLDGQFDEGTAQVMVCIERSG
jgi:hypothetical protein